MNFIEQLESNPYIKHAPTGKQLAFLSLDNLEAFFGGGSGGGKSDALLMAALQYVDVPGYNALIIRDTLKNLTLADALIPRSQEWLINDAHWSEQKSKWTFPSGATLTFGYMDGPRDHYNYQGAAFQFIGVDEAVAIREEQVNYLFSRLRKLQGVDIPIRLRLASNPPTRMQASRGAWVKRRYVDPSTREKGVVFIPSLLDDNPYLDRSEYVKSLDKLDPILRAQLLLGDWETQAAGDFFKREWFRFIDKIPEQDVELRVRFWDMAATEAKPGKGKQPCYTAGLKMARTKNNTWYIESVIRFRKTPKDTEALIRQTADMDGRGVQIRMEMEGGSGGKITIDHYTRYVLAGFDFRGGRPIGNKSERAAPFAAQLEAGNVLLVNGAWNSDFIDEAVMFPVGEFKDQIDVAAGAFDVLTPGKGNAPNVYVF